MRYTLHNVVVQTPWARRTAFQGGSMDVAHDGVRGGGGRRKKKRKMKKKEKKRLRGRPGKRGKKERERALGNNSIKRRTPSN